MASRARRVTLALLLLCLLPWACRSQSTSKANSEQSPEIAAASFLGDSLLPPHSSTIPTTLRYAVQPNEWYSYWMLRTDTLQQDTLRQQSSVQQYYTKIVRAVHPDGRIELGVRIDTLIATFTAPDTNGKEKRFAYDSRTKESRQNPNFAHLTALLGVEVRMLVTPDGRIDSVFGLEAVVKRFRQLSPDTLPQELTPFLERQLEEQMYRPLQQEYLAFPAQQLDSTWTWRHEYPDALASLFPTRNTAEYRIVGVRRSGNRAVLEIQATLRARVQQRQLQEGSFRAELQRESLAGSGRILIDAERGYTVAKDVGVRTRFEVLVHDTTQQRTERFQQSASSYVQFRLLRQGWSKN